MTMSRDEYMAFHRSMCERMTDITRRKNADYCGDSPDPFHNFTAVERNGITDTTTGFLVRLQDKFARIIALSGGRKAQVLDESLEDTLIDGANYLILLAGYLKSKGQRSDAAPLHQATQPQPLKLRVGGTYVTRDGTDTHKIVLVDVEYRWKGHAYPYRSDRGQHFMEDGTFDIGSSPNADDLVAEVQ